MNKNEITQDDIASALNISRVTVSKVLNNSSKTSYKTRERVLQKAQELGYPIPGVFPDFIIPNNTMNTKQDRKVLFVCYERSFLSSYWTLILKGAVNNLSNNNTSLSITLIKNSDEKDLVLPNEIKSNDTDGIILGGAFSIDYYKAIQATKIPLVSIDTSPQLFNNNMICDVLLVDNFFGVYNIVKEMVHRGLKKFSFIGAKDSCQSIHERWFGFSWALHEENIQIIPELISTDGESDIYYNKNKIREIVSKFPVNPDVIVCFNDLVATEVNELKAGDEPLLDNDTLIVGFDNASEYTRYIPDECTVDVFPEEMGNTIADMILWRIDNPLRPYRVVRTQVNPIIF